VIKKPRERGGHSPSWAAVTEKIIIIMMMIMIIIIIIIIPVIIGVTGTFSKSFRKYVSTIPGNHEVKELQKTAILGTAQILRKVLM
jgi:heme/copper-type cytochrome/quinol oxidase subunit 2